MRDFDALLLNPIDARRFASDGLVCINGMPRIRHDWVNFIGVPGEWTDEVLVSFVWDTST